MYQYRAIVVSEYDGDTITVELDQGFDIWQKKCKLRLYGINAPELHVPNGEGITARDFLLSLIPIGSPIWVQSYLDKTEKYGRYLATIYRTQAELDNHVYAYSVNALMVQAGHAVIYFP